MTQSNFFLGYLEMEVVRFVMVPLFHHLTTTTRIGSVIGDAFQQAWPISSGLGEWLRMGLDLDAGMP